MKKNFKENEERAMVRAMCGRKVVDKKTTEEQMDMLGLKETVGGLSAANGVRWYGNVLRRDDDGVLRVALHRWFSKLTPPPLT